MRKCNCGMRIADCGLIPCRPNPKSEIRNPKSRRSRPGVSILEVIFAILVTTIGLLAALTVFPVAAAIARKGRIADETAVSGRAAVHIFDARGMRRPDMWLMWDPTSAIFITVPVASPGGQLESFCIDPRFIANGGNAATNPNATTAEYFPYGIVAAGNAPRMRRITLTNGIPVGLPGSTPMGTQQANSLFTFADDLTLVRPKDGSLPGFGTLAQIDHDNDDPLNTGAGTPPISTVRSTAGHLSWMATLVPKHELYVAPVTGAVLNDQYVLSIVVFHDRPLVDLSIDAAPPLAPPYTLAHSDDTMYNMSERVVGVNFADAGGLGFAGGETFLIWPPDGSTVVDNFVNREAASRMLKVRTGDWIMLAGNTQHLLPNAAGNPIYIPVFKWYRVTEADNLPEYHGGAEQHYALAVSLAGQDWDAANLTNQQAFIISGVVGVYEKTVRLETGTGF